MPACDRVKAPNAPMANSGMSLSVTPPKATRRAQDMAARMRTPVALTSRRLRLASA